MINYNNRVFAVASNSANGALDTGTTFHYRQEGAIVYCSYAGSHILRGQLLGIVAPDGSLEIRYHQINLEGELTTGTCTSVPEMMQGGKIRLHENWQWTSGDYSEGSSILEEQ